MDNISILSKLSMIQGTCTKKEIKIANYIRENIHNIRNLKIEDLSKATRIGYSPIYSLIKKLGFIGYRHFIIAIVAEQERLETNNLHLDETESIFLYYQDMIERNQQTFDDVKFLKTVTLLKKAKGIYLAGLGISSLAVKELATRLFSFGFTCSLLVKNENNIITRASLIQPDDLLICVSLEGKTMSVIAAAKEAKNNGVNVIGVTSKYNSVLSKYTDIMHTVVSSTLYEKNEIFISSLLPLIYWNDNLIKALLSIDKEHQYLENRIKSFNFVENSWYL